MNVKRLELYLGWTCNKRCIFCSEASIMQDNIGKKVFEKDILKDLIKYKKLGYNHVTFLGGEPFIQGNFLFALKVAKKLGYKILVTTNGTTLHIKKQAEKYLPLIDELIISINTLNNQTYKKIHRVNNFPNYDLIFDNIKKYWNGNFLKINIVLNKYNLDDIINIIKYLSKKGINEVSITYPDVSGKFYSKEYIKTNILIKYTKLKKYIDLYYSEAKKFGVNIKIIDIPFCILGKKEYINNSDEFIYSDRLKITDEGEKLDRKKIIPRNRRHIEKCKNCKYYNICWGPGVDYINIFGDSEIFSI